MKVTLESTDQITTIVVDGTKVPARVWEGTTDAGIPIQALITRVAVHKDQDANQFERELVEAPPRPVTFRAFDLRHVL